MRPSCGGRSGIERAGAIKLRVQINGEPLELSEQITLSELLAQLNLAPERLAIERNREVVRRADWRETLIAEGDQIEIVHFVGGGV
jgi:thiamine biosynthesis protein ThiS